MLKQQVDFLTEQGAAWLAKRINAYWAARGKRAGARAEQDLDKRGKDMSIYVVRSSMIGGRPA